jgi:N-dimethylarginine dimethylaminohydrolase
MDEFMRQRTSHSEPKPGPAFLMCRPTFYGIEYEINPWMDMRRQADHPRALRQWSTLRSTLADGIGAHVELVRARPFLPDMGFTANAGLLYRNTFIPSRFRYRERAGEEPFFTSWFRRRGYEVRPLPRDHHFEGEGDALLLGEKLFLGYFHRTDIRTHLLIGEILELPVYSLELVNPYFYHLDTAFMPFGAQSAIYYPKAFDSYSLRVLRENVDELIPVSAEEAHYFACNAVFVGKPSPRHVVISAQARRLGKVLERRSIQVHYLDMSEFIKAGGAAKCLVLNLGRKRRGVVE